MKGWAYEEFSPDWLKERIRLFPTYCGLLGDRGNAVAGASCPQSSRRLVAAFWMHCPVMSMFERLRPEKRKFYGAYRRNHHKLHLETPVHFDHSISEWLQVIHGIAESTEDRAGTVLTSGNWGSRVNKDDLEVAASEIDDGFGVELGAHCGERTAG